MSIAFKLFSSRALGLLLFIVAFAFCAPAQAVLIPGIDVSHWQGNINWESVKNAGVKFAFVKATEGVDFVDDKFHANMQGAHAAGVLVGPYHFCRLDSFSTNAQDPINEANDFVDAIRPYYQSGLYLPPVADVERFPTFSSPEQAQAFTSNWVQKFSDTVYSELGVRPLVYQSLSKANTYYTPEVASTHELWLAWWKHSTASPPVPSDTPLWGDWLFWQWTDAWSVAGIAGNVDGDVFDGTMGELENLLLGNSGTPGDYNRDGVVDAGDFVMLQKMMGRKVPLYTSADGNGNTVVDAGDVAVWKQNIYRTYGAGGLGSSDLSVPEPTTAILALFGLLSVSGLATRSRRNCT